MWDNSKKGDKNPNVYLMQNGQSILLGYIGGIIDISDIYRNLLEQNISIAVGMYDPRQFKDFVNYGGIWDYKARYNQQGRRNTIYGYVNLIKNNNTSFYFEGKILDSQDMGNHHYGVMGKACKCFGLITEQTLLEQAGIAQMKRGSSNPEWQKWEIIEDGDGVSAVMLPPYGDDPRDQMWITSGFYYWNNRAKQQP
jgi:Bacterial toxin 44